MTEDVRSPPRSSISVVVDEEVGGLGTTQTCKDAIDERQALDVVRQTLESLYGATNSTSSNDSQLEHLVTDA
eukprot:CAMPEP_0184686668 /NCGR_PEP_ID=MMETSP0312-20130426/23497_1 /TAXON_ID=31354 /ORGANISM="Compsopogon coeruleus, Strain SAG 36.94" /LENGTH=71 /DNA_ID=CAMNT_0027142007 /DNA_START=68 /DNA_END=280 /DNA_ORIENTATION=-